MIVYYSYQQQNLYYFYYYFCTGAHCQKNVNLRVFGNHFF